MDVRILKILQISVFWYVTPLSQIAGKFCISTPHQFVHVEGVKCVERVHYFIKINITPGVV